MKYTPREYQHLMRGFALRHPRCNLFVPPGFGKTSVGIDVFDTLRLLGEVNRLLVVAPKRVAQSVWVDEIKDKWRESFGHLSVAIAIGSAAERLVAVRSGADVVCINFENLEWLIEQMGDDWPWDMVIVDEVSRLRGLRISIQTSKLGKEFIVGQGSSRAKALARVAHTKVKRYIGLTGSPAPNGLEGLWALSWFVDRGQRLGNSFSAYSDRYFRAVPGSEGYSRIEPMPHSQKLIEDKIRDICFTLDVKDWFPIEDVIERNILVDLPAKARTAYREMEKQLFAEIETHEVEVFNAAGKSNKCLQIASGAVYVDDQRNWVKVHDEKLAVLESIVEETNGEPLLVAYQFVPERERILKAFPKARVLDNNPDTIKQWNAGKIPMLVVHPASAGHGLSLQHGGRTLVDFSSGWNLEYDEQVIERLGPVRQAQSGYKRSVFRYRIVARDTIEETAVLPRLKHKMSVQDSLKAAMKVPRK